MAMRSQKDDAHKKGVVGDMQRAGESSLTFVSASGNT